MIWINSCGGESIMWSTGIFTMEKNMGKQFARLFRSLLNYYFHPQVWLHCNLLTGLFGAFSMSREPLLSICLKQMHRPLLWEQKCTQEDLNSRIHKYPWELGSGTCPDTWRTMRQLQSFQIAFCSCISWGLFSAMSLGNVPGKSITSYMKHVPICVSFGTACPLGNAVILDMTFGVEGLKARRYPVFLMAPWMTIQHSHG